VPYSLDTVQDRTYPLYDEIYAYFDRDPAKPIAPIVHEFVRFILSREGQEAVMRDAKYLPLTAKVAVEQNHKLEEIAK
jgi:phosphate transport system substrate-binding protein